MKNVVGYVPQRPELAARMAAAGILTAAQVDHAQADWKAHCTDAEARSAG